MSQPMAEPETPVVFLHQVERRYHQGDAVLEISILPNNARNVNILGLAREVRRCFF